MKNLQLTFLVLVLGIVRLFAQTNDPKYIMLAWDTSFSMENRVADRDFKFLDNYFKRNQEVRVNLVLFGNSVVESSEYEIAKGDWGSIKNRLKNSVYDGATDYRAVESLISLEHQELLLFTDGAQTFGIQIPDFGIKTFVINSNPYKEQMDLNAILVRNEARLFDYGRPIFSQPNAKNQQVGQKMETQTTAVVDTLSPGPGISLNEVVISENQRVESPAETVNMGNGEVDRNRVGVAVQSIGDEEISPIQTDVAQSVQGRFSGVDVKRNNDLSQVKMRTDNSIQLNNYGLIVVDGVPMEQSNDSDKNPFLSDSGFIDPENIADITVLKGMAATTRYGTLGANGVILITTKNAIAGKGTTKPVDRARLKNNIYEGDLSKLIVKGDPDYIKKLRAIADTQKAYTHYLEQRMDHLSSPSYFLRVYDYFKDLDSNIAHRILSNIAELNAKNIAQLRILAYKYEVEKDFRKALKINEQILFLDENSAQAKFDVALSAEETRGFDQAYGQLLALSENNHPSVDFSRLKKSASNGLRNLMNNPEAKIEVTESNKSFSNPVRYDARILIMWSKSNAQFELQIINPEKRFFTWEHSEFADKQRFANDIENDVNTEEFHLIDAQKDDWFIKVNNLNQFATTEPIYIKCMVYYNFGKPDQRKEIQILPLSSPEDDHSLSLFKISI